MTRVHTLHTGEAAVGPIAGRRAQSRPVWRIPRPRPRRIRVTRGPAARDSTLYLRAALCRPARGTALIGELVRSCLLCTRALAGASARLCVELGLFHTLVSSMGKASARTSYQLHGCWTDFSRKIAPLIPNHEKHSNVLKAQKRLRPRNPKIVVPIQSFVQQSSSFNSAHCCIASLRRPEVSSD